MVRKSVKVAINAKTEARPVAMLVQVASQFESRIYVESGTKKVNAKSIMGMMTLKFGDGKEVYISAERFQLEYTGEDNKKHRPVMIHRAPFGSMERFVAVLIEHTAGHFPLWLMPDQAVVLPISDKFNDYAREVRNRLEAADVRTLIDDRSEKIGRKIRDNEMKHIPFLLVVGEKEAAEGTVAVRVQGQGGGQEVMSIEDFAARVRAEVAEQMGEY